MAITWQIVSLDRKLKDGDRDDVVTTVHWQATDSEVDGENTYSGRAYGSVGLAAPGDSFTPYADITEEQAVGWAKAAIGDDQVADNEKSIENQIDQQKNPTNGKGVPW
tara:strand:+ start:824 stop:1147 length:324 start_codon:yes stop_codon:yes gene_type:complete